VPYKAGEEVLVPDPDRVRKVRATVVTPAEPGAHARSAWVRIVEGANAGTNERVPYEDIEYADA
jgi:hypothetical protein